MRACWRYALQLLRVGGAGGAEHVVIIATRANREPSRARGAAGSVARAAERTDAPWKAELRGGG